MALQLSVAARNARLDSIETVISTSAKLLIYSGSMPANCAASATGTLLAQYNLASDWAGNAASGQKALSSLPLTTTGVGTATAGYFRLCATDGTTCHLQGTVGMGSGDLSLDNTSIASGQTVNITAFTLTDGNA